MRPVRRTLLLSTALLAVSVPALAQDDAGPAQPDAGLPAPDGGLAPSPEDQKLLDELTKAMAEPAPAAPALPASAAAPRGSNPFSNLFNPAISANGLLLGTATTGSQVPGAAAAGLTIQELELQLMSFVDPYFSATLLFSIPGLEGFEVEEGYLSALPQPLGLSLRLGKFRVPFGRENPLHTHALPFTDRALVLQDVLGDEGLSEVGVELSWLAPVPWYSLFTVTAMDGGNDALFGSPLGRDLAGFAGLRNVVDLTDDATLELSASYALGANADRRLAHALGAHLVFKWRPARDARTSSLMVAVEGVAARRPADPANVEAPPLDTGGVYGVIQWQLAQRWFLGGRFEFLAHRGVEEDMTTKQSLILAFVPTEFSALRLQGNVVQPPGGAPPILEGFLQANFTIGAHPAHAY